MNNKINKILMIDNFDSFTFNLVEEFSKKNCNVDVYRNNISEEKLKYLLNKKYSLLVLSPGPSTPKESGNLLNIIKIAKDIIPILGVCLGYQAIVEHFGGKISKLKEIKHGKFSNINIISTGIFKEMPSNINVARYHSLGVYKKDIPNFFYVVPHLGFLAMR